MGIGEGGVKTWKIAKRKYQRQGILGNVMTLRPNLVFTVWFCTALEQRMTFTFLNSWEEGGGGEGGGKERGGGWWWRGRGGGETIWPTKFKIFPLAFYRNNLLIPTLQLNLICPKSDQIQHYFGRYLDEISIWSVDSVDGLPLCVWASCNPLTTFRKNKREPKGEGRRNSAPFCFFLMILLSWNMGCLLPLDGNLHHSLLALRHLDSGWTHTTHFPGSPACNQWIWDFSASIIM